ncbi:MAG TPA: 5-formyltetrahydrofolate cyclo-ligase [Actinomycetota bacterium]|nr:5-formyltetrahydrofolate cyclo-ligase [Actinomycetota bacterium]
MARELERAILESPLEDDRPLPAEWSLVQRFRVSRGTVRRALAELEREGLLWREPGRGTFVNPAAKLRRAVWSKLRAVARPDSRFDFDFREFIPDFEGSDRCTRTLRRLPEYRSASLLFVAPDNNLEQFRHQALADGKRLVVATYAMRRGFVLLDPRRLRPSALELAATLDAMERFGTYLSLERLVRLGRVDAVVSGAAAVTREGVHFGKGHGFLDLEWALLRELDLVSQRTPVIVSVHDCQVIDQAVAHAPYDVTVDVIVTPTRVLRCEPPLPKPDGIFWDRIPPDLVKPGTYFALLGSSWARALSG